MLVWLNSKFPGAHFAEMQKLTKLVPEFGQLTIIVLCDVHLDISYHDIMSKTHFAGPLVGELVPEMLRFQWPAV